MIVSYGENIKSNKLERIELSKILDAIKSSDLLKEKILPLRKFAAEHDMETAAEIKKTLPYFILGTFEDGIRSNKSLEEINYMVLDIDKLDEEELYDLREEINKDPNVYVSFVSPSGNGLKVILQFNTPIKNAALFRTNYRHYKKIFEEKYGIKCDNTVDAARATFLSYDPDIYIAQYYDKIPVVYDLYEATENEKREANAFNRSLEVKKADGGKIRIEEIKTKTPIFCPFCDHSQRKHPNNANAFVDKNDAGRYYIYCSSEGITYWEEELSVSAEYPDYLNYLIEQYNNDFLNHDTIAEAFLLYYDEFFYSTSDGVFYIYKNGKYVQDLKKSIYVREKVDEFMRELGALLFKLNSPEARAIIKYINKMLTDKNIKSVVSILEHKASRKNRNELYEEGLNKFNVKNGILDIDPQLNIPRLIPHSSKYFLTKKSPVEYRPELGGITGEIEDLLLSYFKGDRDTLNTVFQFLGTAITGVNDTRKFIYAIGSGANGKSVFWETMAEVIFGEDYFTTTNFSTWEERKGQKSNEANPELVAILDKRLVITSEATTNSGKVSTELIKKITGGDSIAARSLFKETQKYNPECKIVIYSNHKVEFDDTSKGIKDRLMQVPFDARFEGKDVIEREEIKKIFKKYASQILNEIVNGLIKYRQNKEFTLSSKIKQASEMAFANANTINGFIAEYLEPDNSLKPNSAEVVSVKQAYDRYKQYIEDLYGYNERFIKTRKTFQDDIEASGITVVRNRYNTPVFLARWKQSPISLPAPPTSPFLSDNPVLKDDEDFSLPF